MSSMAMIPIYTALATSHMNALKAIGPIVRLDSDAFNEILKDTDSPLIVVSDCIWGGKKYLTSHKGLTFYCKTKLTIQVPANSKIISSASIYVPYA